MADHQFPLLTQVSPGMLQFGGARMALLEIESGFWSIRRQLEALVGAGLTNTVLQQAGTNGGASFARSLGTAKDVSERGRLFESCVKAYQAAGFGKFEIVEELWPIGRITIRAQDTFEAWMMSQHGQLVDRPICAYTAGVLVGFINVISERQDVVCIEHACQAQGDEACEFELLPFTQASDRQVVGFSPDPKLGRQVNLLEMLFDRMPMGIAVIDREFKLVRCNPTWAAFIEQYTPSNAVQVLPGTLIFDLEPGTEEVIIPLFERVFAGETIHQDALRIESGGIESFWDIVLTPLYEGGQIVGLLNVSIDATERMQVYQTLEQRVEERTRELERRREIAESLRDIIGMINANLPLETFLDRAVTMAAQRLGAAACVLHRINPDHQTITHLASFGMEGIFEKGGTRHFRELKPSGGDQYLQATLQRQPTYQNYSPIPVRLDEIRRDPAIPEHIKAERIALRQRFAGSFSVPLFVQNQVYGGMVFYYLEPQDFSDEQIQLGMTFAEQMALAIENAMLRMQSAQAAILSERTRLARDLHDAVTQTLFSASLIADVLPKLWERNPEMGNQKLEELKLLTRGALSEMRTLLLELRPDTLAEVDLVDLYRHLANAFTGRTRIPVAFTHEGQPALQPDVKEVFYRVVQEALNNIAKHAVASKVQLHLVIQENSAEVSIRDDGCGFDNTMVSPENLGMKIMRERAEAIHARFDIESAPGAGTQITMRWQVGKEKDK